ncbi:MAG: hypothetical protein ACYCZV_08685, partial [Acidimicrobiales bacterium]
MTQTEEPRTGRGAAAPAPARADGTAGPAASDVLPDRAHRRAAWRLLFEETMHNRGAVVTGVSAGLA